MSIMKNASITTIAQQISAIPTGPYKEDLIRDFIINFCRERKVGFRLDEFGNVIAFARKKFPTGSLAFVAHMDHPGFIIEKVISKGSVTALFYGSFDTEQFKAAPVTIFTNDGQVSAQVTDWAPAVKEKAKRATLKVSGAVSVGDLGMWDFQPYKEENGYIYSRACDDFIGCALMLNLIDFYAKKSQPLPFYAVFTIAEETGLNGAKYVCSSEILPKKVIAISVETSKALQVAPIGEGVVIRVGDSQTVFSPEITQFIVDTALQLQSKDKEFKFQRKLMDGGRCEGSVFFDFNYRTGAISIPLGSYHNQNVDTGEAGPEYISAFDMECASKLMGKLVENTVKASLYSKKAMPKYREEKGSLGQKFLN